MNKMSKKIEVTVIFFSILLLVIGSLLILFTNEILEFLPTFLEQKVFHRNFDHDSYKNSMLSLIVIPVFLSILLSSIFFVKFSDKSKIVVISIFTLISFIVLGIISYTRAIPFIDQDLSSEMMFSKECFDAKTFWPKSWYYSMEFRFLNTQLFTAPLFFFTDNLCLIRALQVVFAQLILYSATYFLIYELGIKKLWIKLLACLLAVSPVSWQFFCFVNEGSYYIPHIVFSFIYVGLFITLVFKEHSEKKHTLLSIIFIIFSFLSGLSSIRYILNFTFPMAAIIIGKKIFETFNTSSKFKLKLLSDDKSVLWSFIGLMTSGIGYIFNSIVIASIYSFKNMNKIRFNELFEMKLDDIVYIVMNTLGYNGNVSVLTPGGVTNILLAIVIVMTIIIIKDLLKSSLDNKKSVFMNFVLFMLIFSFYTNISTEMVGRYFTMTFIFFIPVLCLIVESEFINNLKKWILATAAVVMILTNSYLCYTRMQNENRSVSIQKVTEFLLKKGYEFGYAFSNTANPIWFVSNGKIEVAQIKDNTKDSVRIMADKFEIHKWLEQKKFTDKNYYKGNRPVFFTLRAYEFEKSNKKVLEAGKMVYNEQGYVVFEYNSPKDFYNAF